MQSATQSNSGPDPVATATTQRQVDTEAEATAVQNEPDALEGEMKSAAPAEAKTPSIQQENGTHADTAESMEVTQAVEHEPAAQLQTQPSGISGGMELDSASKPSAPSDPTPDTDASPAQKAKNKDKGARDGRKYVPSKKAMIDPLKMDMSKPLLTPLTSSQLSLQCIECHIIFSDHKSKERHLKLSHPAEYEQCILRNALFACYVCDRHFTNSTELMVHQKAHIEKKPFKCPICSQAFKKSSELTVHKKVHFGSDGYACTDCGKPCKTMTLLKYHRRTHTGERPYVCKECGKRFTMSKALQNHMESHSAEGTEGDGRDSTAKERRKKDDGATIKYPCSICKATFKSPKTRLHHIKTKHKVLPANSNTAPAGQQVKQSTPIITPISICQPGLLQVEPNGPLQKVDANIDTEQICRLIESLGNVQKVNQVVILGQVPPHAPPLEVQQVPPLAEPVNLNLNPPQIDFMGLKQTDSKTLELDPSNNQCDPMEQTIILEPITPDGQLENPSYPDMSSQITISENMEVTLVHSGQTETPSGVLMHHVLQQPDIGVVQSNAMDQVVYQNEDDGLKQNLEETIILELTPALIPTMELEQTQAISQNEISSPILEATPDIQKIPDQTVAAEPETSLTLQPKVHTAELEMAPLQEEQQEPPSCPFVSQDPLTQNPGESETSPSEEVGSQNQAASQYHVVLDGSGSQEMEEKTEQDASEKLLGVSVEAQEQVTNLCEAGDSSAKEQVLSQPETKRVPQISELPVNVMSAQELVKVRKRKPARAFFFQGYMQELVGSIHKDDLHIGAQPAKRKRTKKSHLVVKFGPQSKEKKNKEKKPSQQRKRTQQDVIRGKTARANILEKKVPLQKKGRKGKTGKKAEICASDADRKSSTQDPQMQDTKEGARKNKMKKQKEVAQTNITHLAEHNVVTSPVFKKKKQAKIIGKDTIKNAKGGKQKKKQKDEEMASSASANNVPGQHLPQDALLLLKGHKQPQLKVYKLDTSKASGHTQSSPPGSKQSKDKKLKNATGETTNNGTAEGKKKGGRPKKNPKALSLLSSLHVAHTPPEPLKPKTSRKRKTSSKVEVEGVITASHSKRALECKDCGERFSEVASLQKHKTTVHVIESPGLTYTNGNIFEGVTSLDLYQLPKQHPKVGGVRNAATDWDTETEMGEMALEDREPSVSFPALIPSPSLPVPPSDEMNTYEDKGASKTGRNSPCLNSLEPHSPSDQQQSDETPQAPCAETGEPLTPGEDKLEAGTLENSEAEVHRSTDEDIKEDLLLQVDLVTIGEQTERDKQAPHEDAVAQTVSKETCDSEGPSTSQVSNEAGHSQHLQTVSCSTHQVDIKEEGEEISVQKKKDGGKGGVARNAKRRRGRGRGRVSDALSMRGPVGDAVQETESEKGPADCQVIYEKHAVSSDSESNEQREAAATNSKPEDILKPKANKTAGAATSSPSSPEQSPVEQVVFELKSVTTSVDEVIDERGQQGGEEQDRDQSPAIILEKFLTSRHQTTADKELRPTSQRQCVDADENEVQATGSQEIKVEENILDPSAAAASCQNRLSAVVQPQHHRDIRTVLVKEESTLVLNEVQTSHASRHIRWNIEPVNSENTASPFVECAETTRDCRVTPEFNTSQCIFYPVKEEEREVLVGGSQSSGEKTATEMSHNAMQTERQETDEGRHSAHEYQRIRMSGQLSGKRDGDDADGEAAENTERQQPRDLQDFLLQSSDEEDVCSLELCEPQLDTEAEIMAYFDKNQDSNARQPHGRLSNLSNPTVQLQTPRAEDGTREPIHYFSKYFGWQTWVEIATCTNRLSNLPNPVTAREVAQFVGIHIAMGTLKFPSPRLYWKDVTRVPLIAEAMPLSRFLELTRVLKFASSPESSASSNTREGGHVQQDKELSCSYSSSQEEMPNRCPQTKTDPLWKAQPLLCRFKAGCHSLRHDGDYAVDQYPLPLAGKTHKKKPALCCTTIIGFGGFLLHVDLKLGLSDKEDAIEQMVPRGSMVYLCKQELSTPAMLERLLVAGVHGAGRVGGARGQIGDEFVSSDGKLMLRRSHCGFILSTAGNGQRSMASLIDNFETAQTSAQVNRDLQNLYPTPLTASAPTCWPQAVLWYLTDVSLINSWLLYRQNPSAAAAPLTLMAFRLEVSKALILSSSCDTQDSVPPQPPTEKAHTTNDTPNPSLVDKGPLPDSATRYDGLGHWPEQLGEGEGGRCRFRDCQRTSRVLCLKCCVFLCISRNNNCFWNFHNQKSMGQE